MDLDGDGAPAKVLIEVYMKTIKYFKGINYLRIPTEIYGFNKDGIESFNDIISKYESLYQWHDIKRTPAGGISSRHQRLPAWDFIVSTSRIEVTILTADECFRVQISQQAKNTESTKNNLGGRKAFYIFKKICERHNINLNELAVTNGEEYKKKIQPPMIKAWRRKDLFNIFDNVHHIDLNSSYMSGIAKKYPILKPAIDEIYNNRKDPNLNATYKAILNYSYGYFQSEYCKINGYKYALANLSLAAREYNDEKINHLIEELQKNGCRILAINTDGIWYEGDLYHDADEGTDLGQWKHDHKNCTFRMKSDGAYEFIEDGKYTPVVRGSTKLDQIKDRINWKWGDILDFEMTDVCQYKFNWKTHRVEER